jgi:hypothetical protein
MYKIITNGAKRGSPDVHHYFSDLTELFTFIKENPMFNFSYFDVQEKRWFKYRSVFIRLK